VKNVRYEADGNFVTTGGVTSGIDGALYLIGKIDGPDIAQTVADIMVYNRDAPLPPGTILPPGSLAGDKPV
jgi:transcriptional regulator GlxA family with amidase domain